MAGAITKEHIDYVLSVFGKKVADLLTISEEPTFLAFMVKNNLI